MSPSMLAAAAAVADRDVSPLTVSFSVQARPDPGVLPRVVELFAKRGLVPQKLHSTALGAALAIDVQVEGIGRELADYIARCMRQIAGVETVLSSETRSV